jgi:hypothetical protein
MRVPPRVTELAWRTLAAVLRLVQPLTRSDVGGPLVVAGVGLLLWLWWGSGVIAVIGLVTAAVWAWAVRVGGND